MVINNDKGRNSIAALVQSVPPVDWTSLQHPREVTLHDDHSVKTKTTRQYLDVYAIELETISEPSRKLKKISDVKRKVNFRSSQVVESPKSICDHF